MKNKFNRPQTVAIALPEKYSFVLLVSTKVAMGLLTATILLLSLAVPAVAETEISSVNSPSVATTIPTAEKDNSIANNYQSATIYLPDPQTQQLISRDTLVVADRPIVSAVSQIIQGYRGQNICIHNYDVKVNAIAREVEINFQSDRPQAALELQSLSSNNQLALFEAIRQTLLTQPAYNIKQVNFTVRGTNLDI